MPNLAAASRAVTHSPAGALRLTPASRATGGPHQPTSQVEIGPSIFRSYNRPLSWENAMHDDLIRWRSSGDGLRSRFWLVRVQFGEEGAAPAASFFCSGWQANEVSDTSAGEPTEMSGDGLFVSDRHGA